MNKLGNEMVEEYFSMNYNHVLLVNECDSEGYDSIAILEYFKKDNETCFFFESNEKEKQRYSYLGFKPKFKLKQTSSELLLISNETTTKIEVDYKTFISDFMVDYNLAINDLPFSIIGGFVGYFSFEQNNRVPSEWPLFELGFYDKIVIFDNVLAKVYFIIHSSKKKIKAKQDELANIVNSLKNITSEPVSLKLSPLKAVDSVEKYCSNVLKVKELIANNEIEQVVLAMKWKAKAKGSLLVAYDKLRKTNQAPYLFYLNNSLFETIGASCETLVSVKDSQVLCCPIAGTIKRGTNQKEDEKLIRKMLSDPKELMEHEQLVKLTFEDLNNVCLTDSIKLQSYRDIVKFSKVMHISSSVIGTLNKKPLEAFEACFPAGTLSGSNRNKALNMISDLEKEKRGLYGGAIGYIGFDNDLEMCIAIRLAYIKDNELVIQAGAGIVKDSNARSEYQECYNKAKAIKEVLYSIGGEINDS